MTHTIVLDPGRGRNAPTPAEMAARAYLAQLPDFLILEEAGRRLRKRSSSKGRPKTMRPCAFCNEYFSARDMRLHVAEAHPGGPGQWKRIQAARRPVDCPHCPRIFGEQALRAHIRRDHPGEPVPYGCQDIKLREKKTS